jgi:hypothetical protein
MTEEKPYVAKFVTWGLHEVAKLVEGLVPPCTPPPGHDDPETFESRQILRLYTGIMISLVHPIAPKVVVEIGVQTGISTRALLAATVPTEGHVYSCDPDPAVLPAMIPLIKQLGCEDRWHFEEKKSQDVEPRECDMLYVDGDHSYAAVASDMQRHGVMVRDGGLIAMDDYYAWFAEGKQKWIDERWDILDPLLIGPICLFRVTAAKRAAFGPLLAKNALAASFASNHSG